MNIEDLPNPPSEWNEKVMDELIVYNDNHWMHETVDYILEFALTKQSVKPKPCPFCGHANLSKLDNYDGVVCLYCRAKGPDKSFAAGNHTTSVGLWNRRTLL